MGSHCFWAQGPTCDRMTGNDHRKRVNNHKSEMGHREENGQCERAWRHSPSIGWLFTPTYHLSLPHLPSPTSPSPSTTSSMAGLILWQRSSPESALWMPSRCWWQRTLRTHTELQDHIKHKNEAKECICTWTLFLSLNCTWINSETSSGPHTLLACSPVSFNHVYVEPEFSKYGKLS